MLEMQECKNADDLAAPVLDERAFSMIARKIAVNRRCFGDIVLNQCRIEQALLGDEPQPEQTLA